MKLIVVTSPEFLPDEAHVLSELFAHGLDRLHLRKPTASESQLGKLLGELPPDCRARISLHDGFSLQKAYGLGGVHLNGRNPLPPTGFDGLVSRSCHSLDEVRKWRSHCDYLFLSPIFDSISKEGYMARFTPEELESAARDGLIDHRVIALGGVSADRIDAVRRLGFGGVAVLGDLWGRYQAPADLPRLLRHFDTLRRATLR